MCLLTRVLHNNYNRISDSRHHSVTIVADQSPHEQLKVVS